MSVPPGRGEALKNGTSLGLPSWGRSFLGVGIADNLSLPFPALPLILDGEWRGTEAQQTKHGRQLMYRTATRGTGGTRGNACIPDGEGTVPNKAVPFFSVQK